MSNGLRKEDLINIRGMNNTVRGRELKVDEAVSKAVGKAIYTTNPKLIQKLVEWKQQRGGDIDPAKPLMDNILDDHKKVEELKKIL